MKNIKYIMLKFFVLVFITFIITISIGPFLWVLFSSFKTNSEILTSSIGFETGIHIKNYINAFKLAPISKYYINSIKIAILGTILNVGIMSMSAYVIARFQFKGRLILRNIFSMALLVPVSALLLPLYISINAIGLYDNILGLIIVYAGFGVPVSLFIMSSYFQTIPKELEESAYMDGSGFLRTYLYIIVPLARPAFATAAVLQFLLCWNEFQFAMILTTGNESRTLPLALFYFKSSFASDYGAMFAATVLVSLPSILMYIFMQEQVVSGLASGSVKG